MVSMADHDEDLEEGGVELIEWVDVGEEEGEGLLGHWVFFGNLVPEPLRLEVGIESIMYRGWVLRPGIEGIEGMYRG